MQTHCPYNLSFCLSVEVLEDSQFFEDFLELYDRLVNLLACVVCHECIAHERVLRCTSWRNDWIDEDAFVESFGDSHEGLVCIANIQRDDWALRIANLETFLAETLQGVVRHAP